MKSLEQFLIYLIFAATFSTPSLMAGEKLDSYQQGQMLFKQGKVEDALKYINKVLTQNPYHKAALACRVDINISLNQWQSVLADLNQLIKIDPESEFLYTKRSLIYQLLENYNKALSDLNKAQSIKPDNLNHPFEKARLLLRMKKIHHSIVELTKILEITPKHLDSLLLRSSLWALCRDIENSYADLNIAIHADPKNAEALNAMAWFLATWPEKKHRNGKRSIVLATKACQLTDWNNPAILDTLAAAYAETGEFDKAVEFMNKAIVACPDAMKNELQGHLDRFKKGKAHREYAQ